MTISRSLPMKADDSGLIIGHTSSGAREEGSPREGRIRVRLTPQPDAETEFYYVVYEDFDDETCRLEPIENPFGPTVLPIRSE